MPVPGVKVSPAGRVRGLIAKVGVVLFMFLVGLDLDPKLLRGNTHTTIAVSHASIVVPFLLGATTALWLYPLYSLIVLNLGLDLGVITPTVFTMLVLMALVTTFATTPLLDLILGKHGFADVSVALPASTDSNARIKP